MIELVRLQPRDEDRVAELLLSAVPEAHRLASWILRLYGFRQIKVKVNDKVSAWSRRRTIRFELGDPERWFMRIVVNICRDELRRRRRQHVTIIEMPVERETIPAGHDDLSSAIARLTEDEQIVLGLRYGRDLTIPQIAAQTGLPEGTVKSRLHYALEHVRAALDAERRSEEQAR